MSSTSSPTKSKLSQVKSSPPPNPKDKPFKIAHYIQTQRFIRVHLTFKDIPGEIEHHYLIPHFKKPIKFGPIRVGTELIQAPKSHKHTFSNEDREIPKLLAKIRPHVLLCSNAPSSDRILRYCQASKIKTFYIRHGIANKFSIPRIIRMTPKNHPFFLFDYYITHPSESYQYNQMRIPPKKIRHIEGSTTIDYLRQINFPKLKHQILSHINAKNGDFTPKPTPPGSPTHLNPSTTKTILLLQNHQGVSQYNHAPQKHPQATKEYYQILNFLNNYAQRHSVASTEVSSVASTEVSSVASKPQRIHIFTKLKGDGGATVKMIKAKKEPGPKIDQIHRLSPYVTLIFWNAEIPMYHFMFADAIIVEACGTSMPESLVRNPHTIQCQLLAHNDYYDIDKYPLLPQADNLKQLEQWLDRFLFPTPQNPDPTKSPQFQKQARQFISQFYGQTTEVTPKIIDILHS